MRPHELRQGQHHGGVAVVAAGVHLAGMDRGPGQAGALRNGQSVQIRPEGDGFRFACVKEGAYAAGNGSRDLTGQAFQYGTDVSGGFGQMVVQLRDAVQSPAVDHGG